MMMMILPVNDLGDEWLIVNVF